MNDISLYIHIPFCKSKCIYCDFYSETTAFCNESIPDNYIEAILKESEELRIKYSIDNWKTIYVGGGTPSLLMEKQIETLFNQLRKNVSSNTEITFECNPGDVTKSKLIALQDSGVNRLSLGLQSMNDTVLQKCKRRSSNKINRDALELIRKSDFFTLSVDLISGLPEEETESFIQGLNDILEYSPEHISLYSLVIENSTPLGKLIKQKKIFCDENIITDQWLEGTKILADKNYYQYEVSNFCKKGYECIHNTTYWSLNNYLGIGAGATGTINDYRYTNPCSVESYLQGKKPNVEIRDKETIVFEYLMMSFRMLKGISPKLFKERFNEDLSKRIEPEFSNWVKLNKAHVLENGNYALTFKGLLFLNQFLESIL